MLECPNARVPEETRSSHLASRDTCCPQQADATATPTRRPTKHTTNRPNPNSADVIARLVFKITLPCSGRLSDEVDVQVLINITGLVEPSDALSGRARFVSHTLAVRRKKICTQQATLALKPWTQPSPSASASQNPNPNPNPIGSPSSPQPAAPSVSVNQADRSERQPEATDDWTAGQLDHSAVSRVELVARRNRSSLRR